MKFDPAEKKDDVEVLSGRHHTISRFKELDPEQASHNYHDVDEEFYIQEDCQNCPLTKHIHF